MKPLIILVIASFCMGSTCNKYPLGCYGNAYTFEIPLKIYPDKETVAVGDTIWIEIATPKQFTDLPTGRKIDFDGAANLGIDVDFLQLCPDSILERSVIPAVSAFQLLVIKGTFLPDDLSPDRNVDYNYYEGDASYQFKLAVIPKQKGIYVIAPGDASSVYSKTCRCPKAGFQMRYKETNQHTHIYTDFWPFQPSLFELSHMYCLKVQ